MAERKIVRGPFEAHEGRSQPDREGRIGVDLTAECLNRVTLISTWPTGTDAWLEALQAVLGVALPARTGQAAVHPLGLLMRTGPEEFLLIGDATDDLLPALRRALAADLGSVTDLSHARCRIRIEGGKVVDTLSKLFALDFRHAAFPPGELRLTGHHHLPWILYRQGEQVFEAYVFTSYAHDQLHTLLDAAREYGVSLSR